MREDPAAESFLPLVSSFVKESHMRAGVFRCLSVESDKSSVKRVAQVGPSSPVCFQQESLGFLSRMARLPHEAPIKETDTSSFINLSVPCPSHGA